MEFYPKFNGVKIGWKLVTGKQAQLSFDNIFPPGQTSKSNQRANLNKHPIQLFLSEIKISFILKPDNFFDQ